MRNPFVLNYTYVVQWKSLSYPSISKWTVKGMHDYAEDAVSHATQLAEKRSNQRGELRVVRFRPNAEYPTYCFGEIDPEIFYSVLTDAARED